MLSGCSNIQLCESGGDLGPCARHDHHDVRVAREHVDVGGELGIPHLHAAELRLGLRATYLELLDNVRNSLKAMAVIVFRSEKNPNKMMTNY